VISFSQPSSFRSFDPLDFGGLCSSVPYSTCDVHEDQVVNGVGVEKTTHDVIFYEYVWESEEEPAVKDDLLLFAPHSLYLGIFCDSAISVFSCEKSYPNVSTSNHLQDTQDVIPTFYCEDDKYFSPNPPNLSSFIYGNSEGEKCCFSSTPSSNHEDANTHLEISDRGCRDLFTHSFYHDSDSLAFDLSKPSVFDDLFADEVETPQVVEALARADGHVSFS